jgi:NADPH:quinone reductase
MRAIVVGEVGGPEQLQIEERRDPSPGEGELVVAVAAAGLNFIDTYHRGGLYPMELPFVPGLEGAGTVVEVGPGVEGFSPGDRVAWVDVLGSYAELHRVPAQRAIKVPGSVDLEVAAAVLLQGITAHYLATDTFPLTEGDKCLIHAGAGGVGLLLTQIAVMRGAWVVTTVGSEDKETLSRDAGAHEVIVYTRSDFKDEVEAMLGPKPLDVVYDGVGKETFERSIDLLRPRGMMVTYGNASGPVPPIAPLLLAQKGSLFLTRPTMAHYLRTPAELSARVHDLFDWIASGDLSVRIGARFPLAQAAEAHRALEGRETTGKVLIVP